MSNIVLIVPFNLEEHSALKATTIAKAITTKISENVEQAKEEIKTRHLRDALQVLKDINKTLELSEKDKEIVWQEEQDRYTATTTISLENETIKLDFCTIMK